MQHNSLPATLLRLFVTSSLACLTLLLLSNEVLAQATGSCREPYSACVGLATNNKSTCDTNCHGVGSCLTGCQNQYNSDVNACQANYDRCASFGRTACQGAASSYCGLNNSPIGVNFNPDTGICTFTCSCNPGGRPSYCPGGPNAASCGGSGGWYCNSPLLADMDRNGVALTAPEDGVLFDLDGSGAQRRWAWTSVQSNDGWLALDRNGNGVIDNGLELFGSTTNQPAPPTGVPPNGFNALAVFDSVVEGGNNDGLIDSADAIFGSLLLWTDRNHNGISEPAELSSLAVAGISRIDLEFKERKNDSDQFGNLYLYRARTWDSQGQKLSWVWDVFLRPLH